jgi:hypothetical protein
MIFGTRLALAVTCLLVAAPLSAQTLRREPVRAFLDCHFCDFDFLRVETPWVSFVRDRADSDVHLLLTSQESGAGGSRYLLEAIGEGAFAGRRDTLAFSTPPSATDDARRVEIARNVQLALVPFAVRTEAGRDLRIAGVDREDVQDGGSPASDPWNAWVFEVSAGASTEREQRQSEISLDADFEARRITRAWKLGTSVGTDYDRSRFELDDGSKVTSRREQYNGGAIAIHSIATHWGAGAQTTLQSSTFENLRLRLLAAPALEYSIFPYEESTRRQLVLQYAVGIAVMRYREETIFGKLDETRPAHAFTMGYDVRQPWGSANATLLASNYLDDFSQNRLEFDMEWNLRLLRGLEFEIGASTSLIHDQLSIPKRGATDEEILLEQRALRTDYRYDLRAGFSYTFGSIFNSVVNPRFGSGVGTILH